MNSKVNIIILDSNFILLPFQFKIDYLNEIRIIVVGKLKFIIFQQILNELESKRRRNKKSTKFIRLLENGISYIDKNKQNYNIEILEDIKEITEKTDDFLLRKSQELQIIGQNVYLATNDSELRRKAKRLNISTIFLRQKKYLSVERV
ncbi:MAG: PIN domain-containing protein [Candidatus Thorarchaeota archaeon]